MTNPTTTHHTTTTTTTAQKPSTMDTIKDKASNLVDKITGKNHTHGSLDNTGAVRHDTISHPNRDPNTTQPLGTTGLGANPNLNAPAASTTLPQSTDPSTQHRDAHNALHNNAHQQTLDSNHHSGPLHTGAAMAGTAVPHNTPVDRNVYQQSTAPGPGQIQQGAPAGPTGTTHVPTYAQNVPPPAAGVIPTAQVVEAHDGTKDHDHTKHSLFGGHKKDHHDHGLGAHQPVLQTAGGTAPMNTNNATTNLPLQQQQPGAGAVPVQSMNNTVPAMGAPGTTTAAGTHVPGEYHVAQPTTTANPNLVHDPSRPVV